MTSVNTEITTTEKIRRLPWNIALNATNNVFAQLTFFGSAFLLFLNELGASNSQIGFLLSLLPFVGIVALFIAPIVARIGYKRVFVTFFGIRKAIAAGLLLVPWVNEEFGLNAAMTLVSAIMLGFALCRAIAETALYPWSQEFIPDSVRGKQAALNDGVARVTGIAATAFGAYILGASTGIDRFTLLFSIALVFGAIAVWAGSHQPGGAPMKAQSVSYRGFFHALRDRNFARYLLGLGMTITASAPLAFVPLFMKNEVGLSDSAVLSLQLASIFGGLLVTYLIGWAADRYGSKPVMLSGLVVKILLPIAWLLMPRQGEFVLAIALAINTLWGMVEIGWAIGSGRLLFTRVVPREKKGEYMAVFYAGIGLIGGLSQLFSGWLLDGSQGLRTEVLFISIDPFTPLFVISIALNLAALFVFRGVQADNSFSVTEFAELFIHGNPVMALQTVMRYYRAKDEREMVEVTEAMGKTDSPLATEELLDSLEDPRFNVRYEAILAIAHRDADERQIAALCRLLDDGKDLALSAIAAWGLGRIGDPAAAPALRRALDAPWRSIQAQAARSLGMLGDSESAHDLLSRLIGVTDPAVRLAFAVALGQMRHEPALGAILDVLNTTENRTARLELALALARLFDLEAEFIRAWRGARRDAATTIAQMIIALRRPLRDLDDEAAHDLLRATSDHFARGDFPAGIQCVSQFVERLVPAMGRASAAWMRALRLCADRMRAHGMQRPEYLLLVVVLLSLADEHLAEDERVREAGIVPELTLP
jgi:MFS family permease